MEVITTLGINLFCKPVKYECNCPPLIKFRKQMLIKSVNGKTPLIPEDCYVAENATIVGDVSFGESCSVWFNAVIRRRKFHSNRQVNIQDGAIIHCTYKSIPQS
jgi:UDP-3-O-[3-hydroxymyristoyl] glucosamine N-acyltransferase